MPTQPAPTWAHDHWGGAKVGVWVGFFAVLACVYVASAAIRGRFLDEFWTVEFADPRIPFRLMFEDWSADTGHPIGFYLINRFISTMVSESVFIGRLLNLLYLAAAILTGWFYDKGGRNFGMMYCGVLASCYFVIERFTQFRSTFMGLMVLAVIVILVRSLLERRRPKFSIAFALVAFAATLGAFDYAVSIAALGLCGGLGLVAIGSRHWSQLIVAVAAGVANLLVIGASLMNSLRYPILAVPISQPMRGLAFDLALIIATAMVPSLALIALSLLPRRPVSRTWAELVVETPFRRCMLLATFVTLAAFVGINLVTHGLYRRQLFSIIPLIVALPVDVAAQHLKWTKTSTALVMSNLFVAALLAPIALRSKLDFDRHAPTMAREQKSCPSLPIYAVVPERISHMGGGYQMTHTRDSRQVAYEQVARDYGFHLTPLGAIAPRIDPICGAMIWSETVWSPKPITAQFVYDQFGIRTTPAIMAQTQFDFVDSSLLMHVPPLEHRNSSQN